MYEKKSPAQQAGLKYGYKLRCIGAIQGLLGTARFCNTDTTPFTQDEIQTIKRICEDARRRAQEEHEKARIDIADAKARSGSEAEQRQYTGK